MSLLERLLKSHSAHCLKLRGQLTALQARCPHDHVLHANGRFEMSDTVTNPRRICLDCGIEEIGSWWSSMGLWITGQVHPAPIVLGNQEGRTVREMQHLGNEFYSHRLPQGIAP